MGSSFLTGDCGDFVTGTVGGSGDCAFVCSSVSSLTTFTFSCCSFVSISIFKNSNTQINAVSLK
jgi:hypothetical protein